MDTHEHRTDPRPIDFWLRTVDRLLTREFDATFDGEPEAHLADKAAAIRDRVAAAADPAALETTLRTLEAIARELGWREDDPETHRLAHPRIGRGIRPHPRHGRHLGAPDCAEGEDGRGRFGEARFAGRDAWQRRHRRGHLHRAMERAFERGFLAGFDRRGA